MANVERDTLAFVFDRLEEAPSCGTAQWTLLYVFHLGRFTILGSAITIA
jgi:hypothetical protein